MKIADWIKGKKGEAAEGVLTSEDNGILAVDNATTRNIVDDLKKILRKRKVNDADRKRADDLLWMLKQMADAHLNHKCQDYGEEYMKRALRTEHTRAFVIDAEGKPNLEWSQLLHAAMGMVTESAEALDALKKTLVYGKPIDYINLLEEAGDEKWYLALLLRTLKKTDREAGDLNIKKLLVRYPENFSGEKALNRDLSAERSVFEEED